MLYNHDNIDFKKSKQASDWKLLQTTPILRKTPKEDKTKAPQNTNVKEDSTMTMGQSEF
jgi:hypothetical protein